MKQTMKLLFAILLLATLNISCSKDDKDDIAKTKNHFKVGDNVYDLSHGYLFSDGTGDSHKGNTTYLRLLSKDFKRNEHDFLVGKGDMIVFGMFTTNKDELNSMDYGFSKTVPSKIGDIYYAKYAIDFDFDTAKTDPKDDIVSGKVTVFKKGDVYTITINCISDKGVKVTGFYKGKL